MKITLENLLRLIHIADSVAIMQAVTPLGIAAKAVLDEVREINRPDSIFRIPPAANQDEENDNVHVTFSSTAFTGYNKEA